MFSFWSCTCCFVYTRQYFFSLSYIISWRRFLASLRESLNIEHLFLLHIFPGLCCFKQQKLTPSRKKYCFQFPLDLKHQTIIQYNSIQNRPLLFSKSNSRDQLICQSRSLVLIQYLVYVLNVEKKTGHAWSQLSYWTPWANYIILQLEVIIWFKSNFTCRC